MKKFVLLFCMMFLLGSAAFAGEQFSVTTFQERKMRIQETKTDKSLFTEACITD